MFKNRSTLVTSVNLYAERRILYFAVRFIKFFTAAGTVNHASSLFS